MQGSCPRQHQHQHQHQHRRSHRQHASVAQASRDPTTTCRDPRTGPKLRGFRDRPASGDQPTNLPTYRKPGFGRSRPKPAIRTVSWSRRRIKLGHGRRSRRARRWSALLLITSAAAPLRSWPDRHEAVRRRWHSRGDDDHKGTVPFFFLSVGRASDLGRFHTRIGLQYFRTVT